MADTGFEEIILASLFHDLGKVAQRARADECLTSDMEAQLLPSKYGYYSHRHAWYTHGAILALRDSLPKGINAERLANLAARHHNPGSASDWIIAEGDRISSGADRTQRDLESERAGNYTEQACLSVFTSIRLPRKEESPETFLELASLSPEKGYPRPNFRTSSDQYRIIWDGLLNDLKKIKAYDIGSYLEAADAILEHWTWSVPSTTIDQPDISLYDHLRTTAAFASALYRFHEAEGSLGDEGKIRESSREKYALVNGDLSGIQRYLFDLKSAKYSAKILRARSFELRALTESAVRMICREFKVPEFARISNAGGRFLLVLPNYPDTEKRINEIQIQIDVEFIERFAGLVALPISRPVAASKDSMNQGDSHFGVLFNSLAKEALEAKQHKLQRGLELHGHVLHSQYDQLETNTSAGGVVCPVCDIRSSVGGEGPCEACEALVNAGSRLPKARYIEVIRTEKFIKGLKLLSDEVLLLKDEKTPGTTSSRIHEFEPGCSHARIPYAVPMEDGVVKEFEAIADASIGVKHLAMFKADLDNLGFIFSRGLESRLSVSRYATLSRTLDYFFTVVVRNIIETESAFRDIYTVYSGGDDLCVIGPWSTIMDFAVKFDERFRSFTGGNPSLTVSGGIALAGKSVPVRRMAAEAEAELNRAKDSGKNAISLLGVTVSWKKFAALLEDAKSLTAELASGGASTSTVYALLQWSKQAESFKAGDISPENALWKSHFEYALRRSNASSGTTNLLKKYSVDTTSMVETRIPATIALYTSRKEEK